MGRPAAPHPGRRGKTAGTRRALPAPPGWRSFLQGMWRRNLSEVWAAPVTPDLGADGERQLIVRALQGLDATEHRTLAAFLDGVLARNLPAADLAALLDGRHGDILIQSDRPHLFLRLVRELALAQG